jgi:hypothetical protein
VGTRCALLATVLHRGTGPADISVALDRLKVLDRASTGTIGYRYATAELCDALIAGDRDRLALLRDEAGGLDFRTRSWVPVECFLESAGLPLPPTPTQWLEPYEVVALRWAGHLSSYLARHGVTATGRTPPPQTR